MTTHLLDLVIDEISGVDVPAHLVEGWVVQKSASADPLSIALAKAFARNPEDDMSELPKGTVVDANPDSGEAFAKALEEALAPIQKQLDDAEKRAEQAEERVQKAEADKALEAAEAKVASWDLVPELDDDLAKSLVGLDDTARGHVEKALDAAQLRITELAKLAGVTKTQGTDNGVANDDDDNASQEALAKAMVDRGEAPDIFVALANLGSQKAGG